MLVIRKQQMAALRLNLDASFDRSLCEYVQLIAPERFARASAVDALDFATACREKAQAYGAARPLEIAHFAAVALFLGTDFDADPALPWLRAILDGTGASTKDKFDRLVRAFDDWTDALAGAGNDGSDAP